MKIFDTKISRTTVFVVVVVQRVLGLTWLNLPIDMATLLAIFSSSHLCGSRGGREHSWKGGRWAKLVAIATNNVKKNSFAYTYSGPPHKLQHNGKYSFHERRIHCSDKTKHSSTNKKKWTVCTHWQTDIYICHGYTAVIFSMSHSLWHRRRKWEKET